MLNRFQGVVLWINRFISTYILSEFLPYDFSPRHQTELLLRRSRGLSRPTRIASNTHRYTCCTSRCVRRTSARGTITRSRKSPRRARINKTLGEKDKVIRRQSHTVPPTRSTERPRDRYSQNIIDLQADQTYTGVSRAFPCVSIASRAGERYA